MSNVELTIRVACEACGANLDVSIPENVQDLAPPELIIKCDSCDRLLQVSLPIETYVDHKRRRVAISSSGIDPPELTLLDPPPRSRQPCRPPPSRPPPSSLAQAAPTQFHQQQQQQLLQKKDKQPVPSPPVDAPPTKSPRSIMPNLLIEHRLLGNPPVVNNNYNNNNKNNEDDELDLVQIQEQQRTLAEMQAKLEAASQRLLLKQQQQQNQTQEEKEPEQQALQQRTFSAPPLNSTISLNNADAGPGKEKEGTVEVEEGQPSEKEAAAAAAAAGVATGGGGRKRVGSSIQGLKEYQIYFRTEYERLKKENPSVSSEEAISIASKSVRERAQAQTTEDSTMAHILESLPSKGADLEFVLAHSSLLPPPPLSKIKKGKAENEEERKREMTPPPPPSSSLLRTPGAPLATPNKFKVTSPAGIYTTAVENERKGKEEENQVKRGGKVTTTRAILNKNDDGDVSPPEMIFPTAFGDMMETSSQPVLQVPMELNFHSYMLADDNKNNNGGGGDKVHKEAL